MTRERSAAEDRQRVMGQKDPLTAGLIRDMIFSEIKQAGLFSEIKQAGLFSEIKQAVLFKRENKRKR